MFFTYTLRNTESYRMYAIVVKENCTFDLTLYVHQFIYQYKYSIQLNYICIREIYIENEYIIWKLVVFCLRQQVYNDNSVGTKTAERFMLYYIDIH